MKKTQCWIGILTVAGIACQGQGVVQTFERIELIHTQQGQGQTLSSSGDSQPPTQEQAEGRQFNGDEFASATPAENSGLEAQTNEVNASGDVGSEENESPIFSFEQSGTEEVTVTQEEQGTEELPVEPDEPPPPTTCAPTTNLGISTGEKLPDPGFYTCPNTNIATADTFNLHEHFCASGKPYYLLIVQDGV